VALIYYTEVPKAACFIPVCCLVYSSILKMQVICSAECLLIFSGLNGIIPQNIELFFLMLSHMATLKNCDVDQNLELNPKPNKKEREM
jgi:hypothetical protein